MEIVPIAIKEKYQQPGIGTLLLAHAEATTHYADYRNLEIGTGNSGTSRIAPYEQRDFVHDYFHKFHHSPIVENGVGCRNMVRLHPKLN